MPKPTEKSLTYEMVITEIMRSASDQLPTQELAVQMLSALPSSARNPQQAMRQHIRQADDTRAAHANVKYVVIVGSDEIVPMARVPDLTQLSNERDYAADREGAKAE